MISGRANIIKRPLKSACGFASEATAKGRTRFIIPVILGALVLSGLLSSAAADDLQDAVSSYNRGDYSTAFRQLRKLADAGNTDAQTRLGQMYWNGQGVEQDFSMAARLYMSAAGDGYSKAQLLLGQLYFEGVGVAQSDIQAAKWFRAAAEQNVAAAESILAFMYQNGRGVELNNSKAAEWFQKAADQDDPNAQWRLGDLYRLGQGVPQNYVLAHMWFNISASKGDPTALVLRSLVAKLMTKEQIAEAQKLARDWKPKSEIKD